MKLSTKKFAASGIAAIAIGGGVAFATVPQSAHADTTTPTCHQLAPSDIVWSISDTSKNSDDPTSGTWVSPDAVHVKWAMANITGVCAGSTQTVTLPTTILKGMPNHTDNIVDANGNTLGTVQYKNGTAIFTMNDYAQSHDNVYANGAIDGSLGASLKPGADNDLNFTADGVTQTVTIKAGTCTVRCTMPTASFKSGNDKGDGTGFVQIKSKTLKNIGDTVTFKDNLTSAGQTVDCDTPVTAQSFTTVDAWGNAGALSAVAAGNVVTTACADGSITVTVTADKANEAIQLTVPMKFDDTSGNYKSWSDTADQTYSDGTNDSTHTSVAVFHSSANGGGDTKPTPTPTPSVTPTPSAPASSETPSPTPSASDTPSASQTPSAPVTSSTPSAPVTSTTPTPTPSAPSSAPSKPSAPVTTPSAPVTTPSKPKPVYVTETFKLQVDTMTWTNTMWANRYMALSADGKLVPNEGINLWKALSHHKYIAEKTSFDTVTVTHLKGTTVTPAQIAAAEQAKYHKGATNLNPKVSTKATKGSMTFVWEMAADATAKAPMGPRHNEAQKFIAHS